jgi:hypothetical protein
MTPLADGVWHDSAPVRIVGMPLSATMAVLRLDAGGLLLYSPLAMTDERRTAVDKLGAVTDLYAPNTYHHTWIGEWATAFPSARLHAPPGLAKKRRDLRIDRVHGVGRIDAAVDEHRIDGFRLQESVLLHRPSRTLVVADLVHNIGRPGHAWTRIYTTLMGFYGRVALSRAIRWLGFSDRRAARRSLEALLAQPFNRLIVGHGTPLDGGARDALAGAYRWLCK